MEEEVVVVDDDSTVDYGALHESYKRVMGNAIQFFNRLRKVSVEGWQLLEFEVADFDPITLSKHTQHPRLFRLTGVMPGQARRYAYAMCDYDGETRLPWDSSVQSVREHHSFHSGEGKLHYVESSTYHKGVLRWSAGILFTFYDSAVHEHRVTYCKVNHPRFQPPAGAVVVERERWTLFARDISRDAGARRCEIAIIHEGDADMAELLRIRLGGLDTAVNAWGSYYGKSKDPKLLENRK